MTDPAIPERLWRVLVLDRDPADPKWIVATVLMPGDVRPAALDLAGRAQDMELATAWVRAQLGQDAVTLQPVHDALAWRVDQHPA